MCIFSDLKVFLKKVNGEPGEGIHKYRVLNIAILDVIGTILMSYLFSKLFKVSFPLILLVAFLTGIAMHRIFDVRTTIDKLLFPRPS